MPCACDFKCAAAAGCFLARNVLFFVCSLYAAGRSAQAADDAAQGDASFDFDSGNYMDPAYIRHRWNAREDLRALQSIAALFGAVAWFWLMVPIVQSAWVLSRGGKRKVGAHSLLAALAVCGGILELLARLILVGMNNASLWLARDFNLSSWEYDEDGTGWRVLEMIYIVTTGMTLWVDAFEGLALAGIAVLFHYSVATEPAFEFSRAPDAKGEGGAMEASESTTNEGAASSLPPQAAFEPVTTEVPIKPTFSKRFTYFGLFLGVLCLLDFLSSVLQFLNWMPWRAIALAAEILLSLIILPAWLLWLGSQLPSATGRFEREERRNSILSRGDEVEMAVLKGNGREVL